MSTLRRLASITNTHGVRRSPRKIKTKNASMIDTSSTKRRVSPKGKRKLDFETDTAEKKCAKPLDKKKFYFDLQGYKRVAVLKSEVESLGGVVEEFLSKEISCLVTNRKVTDTSCSPHSQSVPSPAMSIPSPFPPTRGSSVKGSTWMSPSPLSTDSPQSVEVKNKSVCQTTRGKSFVQQAAITHRRGTSDILSNARTWGVKIVTLEHMLLVLKKLGAQEAAKKASVPANKNVGLPRKPQVRQLKAPFIKIEDRSHKYRPLVKEFTEWPKLHYDSPVGSCPFDTPKNKLEQTSKPASPEEAKAALAAKKHKKGYCECCEARYEDLDMHLKGEQHKAFATNDKNYESLDNVIKKGASLEDFVSEIKKKHELLKHTQNKKQDQKQSADSDCGVREALTKGTDSTAQKKRRKSSPTSAKSAQSPSNETTKAGEPDIGATPKSAPPKEGVRKTPRAKKVLEETSSSQEIVDRDAGKEATTNTVCKEGNTRDPSLPSQETKNSKCTTVGELRVPTPNEVEDVVERKLSTKNRSSPRGTPSQSSRRTPTSQEEIPQRSPETRRMRRKGQDADVCSEVKTPTSGNSSIAGEEKRTEEPDQSPKSSLKARKTRKQMENDGSHCEMKSSGNCSSSFTEEQEESPKNSPMTRQLKRRIEKSGSPSMTEKTVDQSVADQSPRIPSDQPVVQSLKEVQQKQKTTEKSKQKAKKVIQEVSEQSKRREKSHDRSLKIKQDKNSSEKSASPASSDSGSSHKHHKNRKAKTRQSADNARSDHKSTQKVQEDILVSFETNECKLASEKGEQNIKVLGDQQTNRDICYLINSPQRKPEATEPCHVQNKPVYRPRKKRETTTKDPRLIQKSSYEDKDFVPDSEDEMCNQEEAKCSSVYPDVREEARPSPVCPSGREEARLSPVCPSVREEARPSPVCPSGREEARPSPVCPSVREEVRPSPVCPDDQGEAKCSPVLPSVSKSLRSTRKVLSMINGNQSLDSSVESLDEKPSSYTSPCDPRRTITSNPREHCKHLQAVPSTPIGGRVLHHGFETPKLNSSYNEATHQEMLQIFRSEDDECEFDGFMGFTNEIPVFSDEEDDTDDRSVDLGIGHIVNTLAQFSDGLEDCSNNSLKPTTDSSLGHEHKQPSEMPRRHSSKRKWSCEYEEDSHHKAEKALKLDSSLEERTCDRRVILGGHGLDDTRGVGGKSATNFTPTIEESVKLRVRKKLQRYGDPTEGEHVHSKSTKTLKPLKPLPPLNKTPERLQVRTKRTCQTSPQMLLSVLEPPAKKKTRTSKHRAKDSHRCHSVPRARQRDEESSSMRMRRAKASVSSLTSQASRPDVYTFQSSSPREFFI